MKIADLLTFTEKIRNETFIFRAVSHTHLE